MRKEAQIKMINGESFFREDVKPESQTDSPAARRELIQAEEDLIKSYLRLNMTTGGPAMPLRKFLQELEQKLIACTLMIYMGNQRRVAAILGVKPSTLCEKLRKTQFDNLVLRFNNSGERSAEFVIDFQQRN